MYCVSCISTEPVGVHFVLRFSVSEPDVRDRGCVMSNLVRESGELEMVGSLIVLFTRCGYYLSAPIRAPTLYEFLKKLCILYSSGNRL
jgi:hypothetical protein